MIKLTDKQKTNLSDIGSKVKRLLSLDNTENTNKLLALEFIKLSKIVGENHQEDELNSAVKLLALTQDQNDTLFGAITSIGQSETMDYMSMSLDELETISNHLQSV
jgi:hypothetical protein